MKTKILIISICLAFSFSLSYAQQDFQKWLENEGKKFQEFKDKRDKAFVEFLKKEWLAMQLFQGLVADDTPKPINIPQTVPQEVPEEILLEPSKPIEAIKIPEKGISEVVESIELFVSKLKKKGDVLKFSFFDTELEVNYDNALLKTEVLDPINNDQISQLWSYFSRTNYEDLLHQADQLKQKMNLNDWGYCLLLYAIGENLFVDSMNKQTLFVWFILNKSGYDAKVGYENSDIYLLLPFTNIIYGHQYFDLNNVRYYVVTFDDIQKKANAIYTYDGKYPNAQKLVALHIKNTPRINQRLENTTLKFVYGAKEYSVNLQLKKDVLDLYHNYPQTDYTVYFDASLSPEAHHSLLKELKPIIEGKSEIEAVNMLLRFVQTAFKYEKDETQFGHEKPFFAEETLYYTGSDCEDRSVLFSCLVRNLLGLEVIGLDYPGHIATAVKFSTDVNGDYVKYENEKYIICDATFINANLGQCMPRLKDIDPKIF